jgi:hypothetical protein
VLFVGDDWAEDHHDVEFVDDAGRRLARARLAEGLEGLSRLHALIGEHSPEDWADLPAEEARRVVIGIETDRGPWVQALIAAGYVVFAINPRQVARYRERHSTSGAKSDAGDAHVLAEIVRLDREHHRPVAGDNRLVARAPSRAGMAAWSRRGGPTRTASDARRCRRRSPRSSSGWYRTSPRSLARSCGSCPGTAATPRPQCCTPTCGARRCRPVC